MEPKLSKEDPEDKTEEVTAKKTRQNSTCECGKPKQGRSDTCRECYDKKPASKRPTRPALKKRKLKTFPRGKCIYFIQAWNDSSGLLKIGYTTDMPARFKTIQNNSPVELDVLFCMKATRTYERQLHRIFKKHRQHGEWFTPAPQILECIELMRLIK